MEEEKRFREALEAVETISRAVKSVRGEPRQVFLARALKKASAGDADMAVRLVSGEAGVDADELDDWSSKRELGHIADVLDLAALKIRFNLAVKIHPDQVREILSGEPSGLVYLPPDMLRTLYAFGEAVADVLDRKGGGDLVEEHGKKLMELAAAWVRENRKRWGLPHEWRLVQVRPQGKDEMIEPAGDPPF